MTMRLFIIGLIIMTGCAAEPYDIVTPDGGKGIAVKCLADRNLCIKEISKACPKGYVIYFENAIPEIQAECK